MHRTKELQTAFHFPEKHHTTLSLPLLALSILGVAIALLALVELSFTA